MPDHQRPAVCDQGDAQHRVVPDRPVVHLGVPPSQHGNPHHPDAGGEQQGEAERRGLSPPLLVDGSRVAVAVREAGAAQDVHGQNQTDQQEAQHVDLQHGKLRLAVFAGFLVPHQDDDEPLCGDDDLHGKEPQGHARFPPASSGSEAQHCEAASQQAGEGQREEHPEEEDPGRAGLGGEADDEGEGDGKDASCGQEEHAHGEYGAPDCAAAAVPRRHAGAQGPEQQAQKETYTQQEACRGKGLQHYAPCRPAVTQVPVLWIQSSSTAFHTRQVGNVWGSGCGAYCGVLGLACERGIDKEDKGEEGCIWNSHDGFSNPQEGSAFLDQLSRCGSLFLQQKSTSDHGVQNRT